MHGADSLERAKHCSLAGLAKEVLEPLVEDIWLAAHFLNVANPDSPRSGGVWVASFPAVSLYRVYPYPAQLNGVSHRVIARVLACVVRSAAGTRHTR